MDMANPIQTRAPRPQVYVETPSLLTRFFRAAIRDIREAVSAHKMPAETQFKKRDAYIDGNPYRIQSPRDLERLTRGSSTPSSMKVPDSQILGFLDDLSRHGTAPTRRTGTS